MGLAFSELSCASKNVTGLVTKGYGTVSTSLPAEVEGGILNISVNHVPWPRAAGHQRYIPMTFHACSIPALT